MAATLKRLGFEVILKKNVRYQEMEEAVEDFGKRLRKGGVGLFYYAGHGVQVGGVNYLLPIGVRINKESDVKHQSVSAEKVLDEMAEANNGLNIVLLDACRDNPFARNIRSASRGLAIISSAPEGTFISYSTGPGQVAQDGDGRNSPYTAALLKNMTKTGLPIERVFKQVRVELSRQKQTPWELSSLKGEFYFRLGKGDAATPPEEPESTTAAPTSQDFAMAHPPKPPEVNRNDCVQTDGRFCKYPDGTVLDTSTNLIWAAEDNGSSIDWQVAKSYCENYGVGGNIDWRMPTQDELADLYDKTKSYESTQVSYYVHLTKLIKLSSCCPWASETNGLKAASFDFLNGVRSWDKQSDSNFTYLRALPVRSAK